MSNSSNKKKSNIIRWIAGIFILICAFVNGFHFSSIFLLLSAILMFPLPFVSSFLNSKNIKSVVSIVLSIALFFTGIITSPSSTDTQSDETSDVSSISTEESLESDIETFSETEQYTEKQATDAYIENTTTLEETTNSNKTTMVWVSDNGKKYHSKSTCSNMSSPIQISIEDAKNRGYEPCKKCH